MGDNEYHAGSLLAIEEKDDGQFEVTQLEQKSQLPNWVAGQGDDRVEIDWSFGPYKAEGYVIKSTLEIGVETHVLGHSMSAAYGNLKDGLSIKYNLLQAKGNNRWYLKNGNEVWVHVDISVMFDGSFQKDAKVLYM